LGKDRKAADHSLTTSKIPAQGHFLLNGYEERFILGRPKVCNTARYAYSNCHGLTVHLGHLSSDLVNEITNLSWFSRVWTIQEVARARNPIVICGRDTIPFEHFISGLFRVVSDHPDYNVFEFGAAITRITVHTNIRAALQSRSQTYQYSLDLFKVMRGIQNCGAAEPKDKIFAIHDLFWEIGLGFPPPNYSLSLGTVYWEATKTMFKTNSHLKLLYLVTGFENPALDAPSWVPDFSDTDPPWPIDDASFEATLSSQNQSWLNDDGQLLTLAGYLLDTISDSSSTQTQRPWPLSGTFSHIDELCIHTYDTLQVWALMARELKTYPNGESWDIAFISTCERATHRTRTVCSLCCDLLLCNVPGVGASRQVIVQMLQEAGYADPEVLRLIEKARRPENWKTAMIAALMTFTNLLQPLWKNTFFVTKNGYMGSGSAAIRKGDLVVLVPGLNLPMILRPVNERYRIVAPAFVYGIMFGEKWAQAPTLSEFVIE
jgi:hypothetical protein